MKKTVAFATVAAMGLAASASADVTYTFQNQQFDSLEYMILSSVGDLTGTITAIEGDFVMNDGSGGFTTWASDLTVMLVDGNDITVDPFVTQVGGFTDQGAAERHLWGVGNSGDAGTPVQASIALANPVDASQISVWLGHGYNSAGAWGEWSGSVTLIGANLVPAPGALALLGMAGLVGVRRRRSA